MDSFDKKIKEKLDQIDLSGSDKAWAKMAPLLPKPWYFSLLSNYMGWVVSGILGTVLLTHFVITDHKKSTATVNMLPEKDIATMRDSQNKNTVIHDTVYLEKIITKNINLNQNRFEAKNENEKIRSSFYNTANEVAKTKVPAERKINVSIDEERKNENATSVNNTETEPIDTKVKTELNAQDKSKTEALKPVKLEKDKVEKVAERNDINLLKSEPQLYNNAIAEPISNETTEPLKTAPILSETQKTEVKVPEQLLAKTEDILTEEATKPKVKSKKVNLNARIGMGLIAQVSKFSFGPTAEVFVTNNFSIQSGFLFSESADRRFNIPQEFNKKTGKDFEEYYAKRILIKPTEVRNIKIETAALSIPLGLSYYVPLNYKLNFVINGGANFNIFEKDMVYFEKRKSQGDYDWTSFENQKHNDVFQGLNYGMGLQYKYKKLYFQLIPTFDFPFERRLFSSKNERLGLGFNARYSLK